MVCSICREDKPATEFFYRKTEGVLRMTKECEDCHRIKRRESKFLRKYGITIVEWEKMYESQGGKCAICFKESDNLEVDHNHDTDQIRGLLCSNCNKALGLLKEDQEIMENLIKYLKSW